MFSCSSAEGEVGTPLALPAASYASSDIAIGSGAIALLQRDLCLGRQTSSPFWFASPKHFFCAASSSIAARHAFTLGNDTGGIRFGL